MPWLPPEILLIVTSYIHDPETLVSLQLVSKDWSAAAVSQLDRGFLLLNMNKVTQDIIEKKRKTARTRELVRGVVVNCPDGDYWRGLLRDVNERVRILGKIRNWERLSFFLRAKVGQFPNLDYLALHLRPPSGHAPFPYLSYDKEEILWEAMRDFLKALRRLGKIKKGNSLNEISIQSLPIQARFPGSDHGETEPNQRALTKLGLKALKIGLVSSTVWNHDLEWSLENQPIGDPPWNWVEPTIQTLRHLSITCWGFYTKNVAGACSYGGFFVPMLESLELRGCGFTADFQLDCIVRHGRTLHSLKFDDCAIINRLVLWRPARGVTIADRAHASLHVVDDGPKDQVRLYNTRWAQYFDKIKEKMPRLKHFEIGSSRARAPGEEGPCFQSEQYSGPSFHKPSTFLFGLFPDRYLKMGDASGCACCSWVLQNKPQERPKRQGLILDNSDRDALRGLLEKIGQSVQEDADSGHAGYVRGLMGRVRAGESHCWDDSSSEATSSSNEPDSPCSDTTSSSESDSSNNDSL